ncbi:MAG: hypothetical protein Q9Q40_12055 [Acidobacteriota bacterium]|nr:hypothetical protein [Acidobacteriota bacterium]MDQ7088622.1 hypothetical protein [Acidobacteriota bacterium]
MPSVRSPVRSCPILALAGSVGLPARTLRQREDPEPFDHLLRDRPGGGLATLAENPLDLPASADLRKTWEHLNGEPGGHWRATIDARTGLPTLAWGTGVARMPACAADTPTARLERLEVRVRALIEKHPVVFRGLATDLVLDTAASGPVGGHVWQITFRPGACRSSGGRRTAGLPTRPRPSGGLRRLPRGPGVHLPRPTLDVHQARRLNACLGAGTIAGMPLVDPGTLLLLPLAAAARSRRWTGQ